MPAALHHLHRFLVDIQAQGVSDSDLLQRFVLQRDEAAFELLVWRHAGMVMSVCRAILLDHHLAEDAFQATFLALARKASSIGKREALAGWLYRVAHHAALKARGRRQRNREQPFLSEPVAPPPPVPEDLVPLLHEELGRLSDKYRVPLVLCFLEGLSHTDAARVLGWPKGTVAGRIARAREVLRQRLARRGVALSAALFGTALSPAASSAIPPALVAATVRSSLAFVSGNVAAVSVPVFRLTEGVLHVMFLAKVKSIVLVLCLVCGLVLGGLGALALAQRPGEPANAPDQAEVSKPPDARAVGMLKDRSLNNLKQFALAVHNYHDTHNNLPNNICSQDGTPLLSWRVRLLPYLDQGELYKQFKLDEPWNSKHNLPLLHKMPEVFRIGIEPKECSDTWYQGFAHEDSVFPPDRSIRLADITDGASRTLLVVEAGTAVPWTRPVDLPYAADKPLPRLGGPFKDVIHAVFADGHAVPLRRDFNEKHMRLAITRNDGEVVDVESLQVPLPPRPAKPELPLNPAEKAMLEALMKAKEAEVMARLAEEMAAKAHRDAEAHRQENLKVKAELREVITRIEKLLPAEKSDNKPVPDEVKAMREELRLLRDKVKLLEQSIGK
jgi:RNA polymerase sigma factor (sigma-70 family)